MKKIISLILAVSMLISLVPTVYAAHFSDFGADHWAYEYVNVLVNDGTINGYTDGTFRPAGIVTRAEFVKMIGEGSVVRTEAFDDVPTSHWAYKYIMSSGLKPAFDNMFMPTQPITRGEVAELLWLRAGEPAGVTAPPVVHRQGDNFDAISWVYTNGIMVGSDYIDLRLNDTLTRAEASALIVRARNVSATTEKTNFYASVNQGIFEADPDLGVRQHTRIGGCRPLAEIKGQAAVLQRDRIHKGGQDDVHDRQDDGNEKQTEDDIANEHQDLVAGGKLGELAFLFRFHIAPP